MAPPETDGDRLRCLGRRFGAGGPVGGPAAIPLELGGVEHDRTGGGGGLGPEETWLTGIQAEMHLDRPDPQGQAREGGAALRISIEIGFQNREHIGGEAHTSFISPCPHQFVQFFRHQQMNLFARQGANALKLLANYMGTLRNCRQGQERFGCAEPSRGIAAGGCAAR